METTQLKVQKQSEKHEHAAKHHDEDAGCIECGYDKGGEHHGKSDKGHAIHAALHLIDIKSLPETSGTISRFLFNVHGEVDGFLLDGTQQVHFPSHMSAELLNAVKIGEIVKVHGVKPLPVDLLVAVSVTGENGAMIVDHGPSKKH